MSLVLSSRDWPADTVERRPVADLVPSAKNARTHSPEQVKQIADSIREWGWTTPVLIDEANTVLAGHGRLLAAAQLGVTEVPVMVARGWNSEQKRAYVLADNKLALNAGWDETLLRAELADLAGLGTDLLLIGFNEAELVTLLADGTTGLTDPDEAPAPPTTPVSMLGDLWALGTHRLICGDSTTPETVRAVLAGVTPHLMVTDPPYGVEYDPAWRERAGINGPKAATGVVLNDDRADWREAWALFPGDVAYVWHAGLFAAAVTDSLVASGFHLRSQIVWAKQQFAMGRGDYHWQHEPCWYAVRKGKTAHYDGGRKQSTLWQIDKPHKSETGHSTQKPVECMKRPIENNSSPGQAVYDPFCGSGTTLIAAEITGRACHAIELNPAYVDVIIRRWEAFTGAKATMQGASFAEVAAARGIPLDAP